MNEQARVPGYRRDNLVVVVVLVTTLLISAAAGAVIGWVRPTMTVTEDGGDLLVVGDGISSPGFTAVAMVTTASLAVAMVAAFTLWNRTRVRPLIVLWASFLGFAATVTTSEIAWWTSMQLHPLPASGPTGGQTAEVFAPFNLGLGAWFLAPALAAAFYWSLALVMGDSRRAVGQSAVPQGATVVYKPAPAVQPAVDTPQTPAAEPVRPTGRTNS